MGGDDPGGQARLPRRGDGRPTAERRARPGRL
jgi:hypothetical protein